MRHANAIALPLAITMAGCAGLPAVAPVAEPVDPSHEPGPGRPRVHVEVQGRSEVQLLELSPGDDARRGEPVETTVCTAPCDRMVDGRAGQTFALGGPALTRSRGFTLIDADDPLTIHVRPGRRAVLIAGWVLASIGAATVIAGATTLTIADDDRTLRRAGGFTFVAALPVLAGGIVMVALGRTRFRLGDRKKR
jgi:hypothetical protein